MSGTWIWGQGSVFMQDNDLKHTSKCVKRTQ